MADVNEMRETLTAFFPDLDIEAVLRDFPDVPIDNLANILYEIPPYMNTYRKIEQPAILAPPPVVVVAEIPEVVAPQNPPPVDYTEQLCNELVRLLRADLNTDKMPPFRAFEQLLKDAFPTIKEQFFPEVFNFTENRRVSSFIASFFVFNNLSDRLDGIVPENHELFKHLELSEAAENIESVVSKFATYDNVNEIIEVLKTYKAIIDVETLVLTHQFTCLVCSERFSDNIAVCCRSQADPDAAGDATVSHKFCPDCVSRHTSFNAEELQLTEGGAGLKCFEDGCNKPIYISEIRSLLTPHVINRLEDRVQNENIAALGIKIERCDACGFAIEIDDTSESSKVFVCQECKKAWCRMCKTPWDDEHFGLKCDELVEKQKTEKKDKYWAGVNVRLNEVASRKCHRCNLQFVKSDGCNYMKCPCGATQCYLCRAENIDHYAHFCNHVYDPALRYCTQCNKCSLTADAAHADNRVIEGIVQEASNVTF